MANVKFKLDCPKCETEIVIRSSAQIGHKTECPKCKYRFTVPDVDDEDDEDGEETPKAKGKKGQKAKKGGSKVLIGVVLGVLALGGLGLGAYLVLGGEEKKPAVAANPAANSSQPKTPAVPDATAEVPAGTGTEPPMTPEAGNEGAAEIKKPKKPRPSGLKEITNLLPGETVSVWHLRMDELSKTPLYDSMFDSSMKELFLKSLTFEASDIDEILHCYVGTEKEAFAIIRTKGVLDTDELTKRLKLEVPKNNDVKGRQFYLLQSNAFLTAIGKSLSLGLVLGVESPSAKAKPVKPGDERKLAFTIYDSQTIVLADQFVMERFLSDLKADGLPPFKSELTQPNPAAPEGANPMPGGGGGGPGGVGEMRAPLVGGSSEDAQQPMSPPGGPPRPMGPPGGSMRPPGAPMGPPGSAAPAAPARKSFTSNPYFRTIDPELKKALNTLEDDDKDTPAAVYVQKVDQRSLGGLEVSALKLPQVAESVLVSWLQQVKVLGFSVTAMNKSKGVATGYFEYLTDDDAKKSVNEHILPVLNALKLLYTLQLRENVNIRDLTQGQGGTNQPGAPMFPGGPGSGGFPGGPGSGYPTGPGGGFPGSGGGPPGRPNAPNAPGRPNAPGAPSAPGGGGDKDPGAKSSNNKGNDDKGTDSENAQQPSRPPGFPGSGGGPPGGGYPTGPPGGPGGGFPGSGGGPPGGFPGSGGGPPGFPGAPGNPPGTEAPAGSHIDVTVSDTVVSVQFELDWQENTYRTIVVPGLGRITGQIKGRMTVLSGDNDAFSLANALKTNLKDKGTFPVGALEREVRVERYSLPYPPEQRVSLFAELLPYLGKAGLRTSIQDKKVAWYAPENLAAAETWVPEFLVPYYEPSAWRATHELAEGKSLGATNFVGIAGLGLDAARYDPKNPATMKKLGMFGYDWTSKPADVTDGLSNTIAMMQVPPGYQRPWIVGGGATIAGIDDRAEKPLQNYVTKLPSGVRGTTVLMGDGSVRTIRDNMDPALFKAMVTRAGGESLDDLDKVAPKSVPTNKPTELSTTPAASSVKAPEISKEIDLAELKKLQGKWVAVVAMQGGLAAPPDELKKLKITCTITGTKLSLTAAGRQETGDILKIEATASPKIMEWQLTKSQKLVREVMSYEFEGSRLKMRSTKEGIVRPTSVAKPTGDEKDAEYLELEKAE